MNAPVTVTPPQYFHIDAAPNIALFQCEPLHASITAASCARQWMTAQYPCDRCSVGALHASALGMRRESDRTTVPTPTPCLRCERKVFRRVGGRLCVSCWNRAREWRLGRNAKGGKPTIPLRPFDVLMISEEDGLRARPWSGISIEGLGGRDYSVRLTAMSEQEVERTVLALWPGASIVAIGMT